MPAGTKFLRETRSVDPVIVDISQGISDGSSDVLLLLRAVPASAVHVPRVLVGLGAPGELGAGVLTSPCRRRFEGQVEAPVVIPREGFAHDVRQQRGHQAPHHAVAERELGVGLAQRPLEAVGGLRGLHQVHLQGRRGGREKGLFMIFKMFSLFRFLSFFHGGLFYRRQGQGV